MLMVRPSEPPKEQKTAGGILIPTTAAKEPNNGKIIILGKALPSDPHGMNVGDLVYYGERAGQEIILYDEKYRLLNSKEVLTYIEKEELERILN
jgi:chaperonin GroES